MTDRNDDMGFPTAPPSVQRWASALSEDRNTRGLVARGLQYGLQRWASALSEDHNSRDGYPVTT